MTKYVYQIGSVTHAMRAQRLLGESGINSKVVKTSDHKNNKGCSYGIEFDAGMRRYADKILSDNNIRFSYKT